MILSIRSGNMAATVAPRVVPYESPYQSVLLSMKFLLLWVHTPVSEQPIFLQGVHNLHHVPGHKCRRQNGPDPRRICCTLLAVNCPTRPEHPYRSLGAIPGYDRLVHCKLINRVLGTLKRDGVFRASGVKRDKVVLAAGQTSLSVFVCFCLRASSQAGCRSYVRYKRRRKLRDSFAPRLAWSAGVGEDTPL